MSEDWANQMIVLQLLIDVGGFTDAPGKFLAGIEFQYWRNKFGVEGTNEIVVQPMVQWIL